MKFESGWKFREMAPNELERDVTEFDQFHTDKLSLSSALLREAIQNSLDAAKENANAPVHVCFDSVHLTDTSQVEKARTLFSDLKPHLIKSNIQSGALDHEHGFRALIIEDFGTTGLTGVYGGDPDEGDFSAFWQKHGISGKGGSNKGRWGLGKIVFAASSEINSFLGMTVRHDDAKKLLMGQAILKTHRLGGKKYQPHAYFAEVNPETGWFTPFTDESEIESIQDLFCLERANASGLSIIIPYPKTDIRNLDEMLKSAIDNYFYPIMTGRLQLDIDGLELRAGNIYDIAKRHWGDDERRFEMLNFVKAIHNARTSGGTPIWKLPEAWGSRSVVDEELFDELDLESIRREYSDGELLGFELPFKVNKKVTSPDGSLTLQPVESFFEVFVQRPENLSRGKNLYIRNGLVISDGGKQTYAENAFGALIAEDIGVSAFLGDAENPAHTTWTGTASKLKDNYASCAQRLRYVRDSLIRLHALLASHIDTIDEDALIDFFHTLEPNLKGKRGKRTPPKPNEIPPPTAKPVTISHTKGGFRILPGEGIDEDMLPLSVEIRAAYDVLRGNPFKRYEPFDFDFSKNNGLLVEGEGINIVSKAKNSILLEFRETDFTLKVSGFDPKRDLKVRAVIRSE